MKDSRRAADTVLTASCPYAIAFPSLPSFESHHSPPRRAEDVNPRILRLSPLE